MASGAELGRRAERALAGVKDRVQRRAAGLTARTRELAGDARTKLEASRAKAGPEGWRPARIVAGAAGAFLVWRALFGRGLARLPAAIAGLLVLQATFARASAAGRRDRPGSRRERLRSPEVVEAKSPSELEPGIASASPKPTFASGVDRGARPDPPPGGGKRH